jgi:streptogramin lyase
MKFMRRAAIFASSSPLCGLLCAMLAGCGGGSTNVSSPPPSVPGISFSTTIVAFPNTVVHAVGTTVSTTITNTGTATLDLSGAAVSGADANSFAISANSCGTTLAAAATCTVAVTFTPAATSAYSAALNFTDNAGNGTQAVALSGTGVLVPSPNSCKAVDTTSPVLSAPTSNLAGSAFSGKVMAGQLPVIGASVQVYAAGTAGNGSTPTALLSAPLTTDANGAFSVPAAFTCPYSNSVLYAVASGGQAGMNGAANAGIVLADVLGECGSLSSGASVTINEATTVAMAYAMAQFMSAGGKIGATATNSSGIALAAATAANLVDVQTGAVPGANFPATGAAPIARIDSLANLLNACVVSSGPANSACSQLDTATANASGTPASTLDAALNLVKQPEGNVAALYTLSGASTAYAPTLAAAPSDWTLFVTYAGGGMNNPSALSIDSTGKVWVANYFSVASLFSNTGTPVFATGITGDNLNNSYGGAVDVNDDVWIANEQSTGALNGGLGTVTLLNSAGASPATYGAGGLNFPISVAFDTGGVSWVVDYGNSHLTLLSNSGTALSGTSGYASSQFVFPVAVTTDSQCNGWVANQSGNTITKVIADGSSFTSYTVGQGPSGVAVDAANNVWSANYYGNSVGLVSAAGSVLSGTGYTGGGLNHPQGIAVDGAGNVWVANYRGPSLTELARAAANAPGQVLSPAAGWAPEAGLLEAFATAIDASGNVWVSNYGSNTLTEFVGLAAPVKTPLLGPVRVP